LYGQTPVFKSSTRLVTVNAVVQGKDGSPLTGLTKSNFQLLDNGEPQQIVVFSEASTAAKPAAVAKPDDQQPLPDVFSNRVPPTVTARSNVTVVLLDALNTDIEDQSFARDQVIRYLRQIQPGDHIGLYALGSGLTVLHDFTTDSSDLLAAVEKYGNKALSSTPGQSTPGTVVNTAPTGAPGGATMSSMTNSQNSAASDPLNLKGLFSLQASTAERDYLLQNRIVETLDALTFIAEHLAVFPGRKSLVWVSGGFPLSVEFGGPQSFSAENHDRYINTDAFKRCMRIVNAANIAIYPVDAHGVSITGNYAGAATARPDNSTIDIAGVDQQQTMRLLASRTGGKAFINRNDLSHAIGEAVGDSAVSYTLGFYPTHQNSDGSYHKITLKLAAPHDDLRYREGYFDVTKPSQDQNARLADLTVAAASPIDANGISLTAQVLPGVASGKPAGASALQVTVQINPRTITLTNKDGLTVGLLDILFVQHDKVGRSVNVVNNSIDLKAGSDELAKIRRFGILFNKDLERAKGAESLRVIVRDVESGTTGSLTVPFSELKSAKDADARRLALPPTFVAQVLAQRLLDDLRPVPPETLRNSNF
jgi:VWFA-related protein